MKKLLMQALRTVGRFKTYTALNLAGLVLSLSCAFVLARSRRSRRGPRPVRACARRADLSAERAHHSVAQLEIPRRGAARALVRRRHAGLHHLRCRRLRYSHPLLLSARSRPHPPPPGRQSRLFCRSGGRRISQHPGPVGLTPTGRRGGTATPPASQAAVCRVRW